MEAEDLYAGMDWLGDRQERIEKGLAARHLRDCTLVLYDVSPCSLEGRPSPLGRIGHLRDGKVLGCFEITITDTSFTVARKPESIAAEAALDGIYVLRTSVPEDVLGAEDAVPADKDLAKVERALRCLKTVFLMWPEPMPAVRALLDDMRGRAERVGRRMQFGYRVHVIVRETESEARAAARSLVAQLDAGTGEAIRKRSLDHASIGVQRQAEMREAADDEGFIEEHLWTGIGRARSGCGAAIVGDPDQVLAKLNGYAALGIRAFILSGYPHAGECDLFARYVLPRLAHGPLEV